VPFELCQPQACRSSTPNFERHTFILLLSSLFLPLLNRWHLHVWCRLRALVFHSPQSFFVCLLPRNSHSFTPTQPPPAANSNSTLGLQHDTRLPSCTRLIDNTLANYSIASRKAVIVTDFLLCERDESISRQRMHQHHHQHAHHVMQHAKRTVRDNLPRSQPAILSPREPLLAPDRAILQPPSKVLNVRDSSTCTAGNDSGTCEKPTNVSSLPIILGAA
jgi:hypothetical protein